MAGKHDTTEPSWRPLAQKLTGLMGRRGSAKSKKSLDTTDEKASVFRFKRQKKEQSPESSLRYEPLKVDLDKLEAMHLSDGWLDTHNHGADHEQRQGAQPAAQDNTTTPIAALFANKSVLDMPNSVQLSRSDSQNDTGNGRRPFSMIETHSVAYHRVSSDLSSTHEVQFTGSVLDRGRPIEPKRFVSDPLWKTKGLRQELPPPGETAVAEQVSISRVASPRPLSYSSGSASVTSKQHVPQSLSSQHRAPEKLDVLKRNSMYASVTPSQKDASVRTRPTQEPRSASAAPLDRIKAWQKSITSAPRSPATSTSALTPAVPSQAGAPVRRLSTRGGVASNRLAWIRELEEKKSSSVNRDIGVLKKQVGSVSDKLAMFESKQGQTPSPAARLPPLTRSNSTTSRFSMAAPESTTSATGNVTATPRTSIDTVRSSHRTSSVMDYYDDSFREKMESVAGSYAADKDKDKLESEKRQRVTAKFISVKSEKGQVPQTVQAEPEVAGSSSQPEKEKVQLVQLETAPSLVEVASTEDKVQERVEEKTEEKTAKKVEEDEKVQPEAGPSQEEPEKGKEVVESSQPGTVPATGEPETVVEEPHPILSESIPSPIGLEKPDEKPQSIQLGASHTPAEAVEGAEELPSVHAQPENSDETIPLESEVASPVELEKSGEKPQFVQLDADASRTSLEKGEKVGSLDVAEIAETAVET
ncbi:hypothetical protein JX266_003306 [Neoarthrinium moseri]|nr:hypothetical protein JX266_003306 [Neoarthrinium moseri]